MRSFKTLFVIFFYFNPVADVELIGMFEFARDVGMRGLNFKLVISVYHTDMGRMNLGLRVVKF